MILSLWEMDFQWEVWIYDWQHEFPEGYFQNYVGNSTYVYVPVISSCMCMQRTNDLSVSQYDVKHVHISAFPLLPLTFRSFVLNAMMAPFDLQSGNFIWQVWKLTHFSGKT